MYAMPCYSVETDSSSSKFQALPQATPTQPSSSLEKANMQGEHDSHCKNEGTATETSNYSSKCSITKDDLQGAPMTKARILDVYSDVFTENWKVYWRAVISFSSRKMQNPQDHAPRKVPIHLQNAFHKEIRNFEPLGILEPVKEVTEWVNSFVIMLKRKFQLIPAILTHQDIQ